MDQKQEKARARLTKRRLEAIEEALHSRLAGEIFAEFEGGVGPEYSGGGHLTQDDYESALAWVEDELKRRGRE